VYLLLDSGNVWPLLAVAQLIHIVKGTVFGLVVCAAEHFSGTAFPETTDILTKSGETIPFSADCSSIIGTMIHLQASAGFHGADS